VDHLERTTENAVKFAVNHNLPSMYVTEDTIRTDRDTVKRLYSAAIRSGARAIVLCDTVGHATPQGTYNLVKFVMEEVVKPSGENIRVDHGHCDRGWRDCHSLWAVAAERIRFMPLRIPGRTRGHADGTDARQFVDGPIDRDLPG
jgi:2-isopropylmalate synthase